MKKKIKILAFFLLLLSFCAIAQEEAKNSAYALYATKNYKEAYEIFNNLKSSEKTAEIFLLMSNIELQNNNENSAIQLLNKALDIDYTYQKAYYNLGNIFASKKSYLLAINNFELAIKYDKTYAPAYYNLACCQMKLKNYEQAKKNLLKSLELEPKNKDGYYNLAYCYKQLGKEKTAKKILETYNSFN